MLPLCSGSSKFSKLKLLLILVFFPPLLLLLPLRQPCSPFSETCLLLFLGLSLELSTSLSWCCPYATPNAASEKSKPRPPPSCPPFSWGQSCHVGVRAVLHISIYNSRHPPAANFNKMTHDTQHFPVCRRSKQWQSNLVDKSDV